jgi:hypothetical protein
VSPAIALVLLAATWRWWRALAAAFLDDLRAATSPPEVRLEARADGTPASEPVRAAPVNRRLAFRGVARRRAARRRWQAGFGRRGL